MKQLPNEKEIDAEKTLTERIAVLQQMLNHLESLREEEKRLVARELHNDMGSALTSLNMYLNGLFKALPEQPEWQDRAKKIKSVVESLVATTRGIQFGLHPITLDLFGLKAGISEHIEEFAQQTGIECKVSLPDEEVHLAPQYEITVYRMMQEALQNIAKHARAVHVDIILDIDEEQITLTVRDDGIGISQDRHHDRSTFGLRYLCERAAFFGGTSSVAANHPTGTIVRVQLPAKQ